MKPNDNCYCLAVGAKDKHSNTGFIYRVEYFKDDILVKGFSGNAGSLHWLFILN